MKKIALVAAALLGGCGAAPSPNDNVPPPSPQYVQTSPASVVDQAPAPEPVVSIYVEPPLSQPPAIRIEWAPPPMLVDTPQPIPYDGAIWTGGYWVWEGNWVWAHGRWASPPQSGYGWVNPYYENRGGSVVFVNGFWAAPGVSFVAPSLSGNIAFGVVAMGVVAGPRPIGPQGVFVPAPPGSHFGLIVPAPIGTAPAVVTGAPPIIREGMRINVNNNNSTTTNNVRNVTNVTNITNVTIIAPASATADGHAVNSSVPAQAHLAAAIPPVVKAYAPEPASTKPMPAYVPGKPPATLPPAQVVHSDVTRALAHSHTAEQQSPAASSVLVVPPAESAHRTVSPVSQIQAPHPISAPPAAEAPIHPASIPQNPSKQSAMQSRSSAPQDNKEHVNQPPHEPKPAPINQVMTPQKAMTPVAAKPQKPNDALQKKPEVNQPKEEGKPAEKHEKE